MRTVGVGELKKRLECYLHQVQAGETILIARRGGAVAELRPLSPAALELDARLHELAAEGVVRLPARLESQWIPRITLTDPPLSDTIRQDRGDRF